MMNSFSCELSIFAKSSKSNVVSVSICKYTAKVVNSKGISVKHEKSLRMRSKAFLDFVVYYIIFFLKRILRFLQLSYKDPEYLSDLDQDLLQAIGSSDGILVEKELGSIPLQEQR